MTFAGATAATEVISVAGSAAVTPRLSSRPMRQPRPVKEVSSAGGAAPGRISQGRGPRLDLHASKGARAVLRGGGAGNGVASPDHDERLPSCAGYWPGRPPSGPALDTLAGWVLDVLDPGEGDVLITTSKGRVVAVVRGDTGAVVRVRP